MKTRSSLWVINYRGPRGRKLQDGVSQVRLFGEDIAVNAEIAALHGTSGHADRAGLIRWLEGFRVKPQMVFVNHGDDIACTVFQNRCCRGAILQKPPTAEQSTILSQEG